MADTPEFYPMPSFPTLAVGDIVASTQWYQDKLGFALVFQIPGPAGLPVLTHLRWAKYADLLLVPDQPRRDERRGVGVTLNFAMGDASIDEFAEAVHSNGVVVTGPVDQPWNARELTLADPDGYRLTFTQPINLSLSMDDVTKAIRGSRH